LDKPATDIPEYVAKCVAAGPGADFFFVLATDERGECDVAHVGNGPRAEANARLIAAAPDGLEAAHEALIALEAAPDSVTVQLARKKLRAFIAKAEVQS
jgi:hypothetical protein